MRNDIVAMQDPDFKGYYDQSSECPEWAGGYDCRRDATDNKENLPREYNEVRQTYPGYKPLVPTACLIIRGSVFGKADLVWDRGGVCPRNAEMIARVCAYVLRLVPELNVQ